MKRNPSTVWSVGGKFTNPQLREGLERVKGQIRR